MARRAKITRIIIPPVYVGSAVDRTYSVLRAVEQLVLPRYDRKNREPRVAVVVQRWDPIERRWLPFPIAKVSILRSGFQLCPNALRALDVPPASCYAWRRQRAAPDARGLSRCGGARRRSEARTGDDAAGDRVERSSEPA